MKRIILLVIVLGLLMSVEITFSEENWPIKMVPFIGYGDKTPYAIPSDWRLIAVVPSQEKYAGVDKVYLSSKTYLWFQDKNGNVYVLSVSEDYAESPNRGKQFRVDQTTTKETWIHKLGVK